MLNQLCYMWSLTDSVHYSMVLYIVIECLEIVAWDESDMGYK